VVYISLPILPFNHLSSSHHVSTTAPTITLVIPSSNFSQHFRGLDLTTVFKQPQQLSHHLPLAGFNVNAISYTPPGQKHSAMPQVSAPPSPYFEARLLNLEEGHMNLCGDVDSLTEMYHSLYSSVDRLKKGGWGVTLGPFQEQDLTQSHQSAVRFKQELENLSREVHESVDGVADIMKANGTTTIKTNGSVPPHLRATNGSNNGSKSVPPHLRGKNAGASDMNG
jgi:hypothetical protein